MLLCKTFLWLHGKINCNIEFIDVYEYISQTKVSNVTSEKTT